MTEQKLNDTLETRLRIAEAAKAGSYDKRTDHLDAEGNAVFINRLILEDSPYLLQHAHNPVNWYAWGQEAFTTAEREHKPVFLSIGYSTCHWCHVMEVESFDNIEVAKVLNEHFVCIKLDREQFPDIDEVYMTGVQIISGQGGWPMSSFLLANGKPFFAATYFPAAAFTQLLTQIVDVWHNKYQELVSSADQVSAAIDQFLSARQEPVELKPELAESMLQALLQREDRHFGGLAGAPKFPQEPLLLLLLDRVRRNRELETLAFVERALEAMASGGIYDQVAGGFHRYSVDAQWLVPHFEKMLYNQSQLGMVYLQAWQLTGNPVFRRVCEQTLNYVVRDMQCPEGGFYSATDADSEGREGTFFVWHMDELDEVLSREEMNLVNTVFELSSDGNFEGANILSLRKNMGELAHDSGDRNFFLKLDQVLRKLYEVRERRIHPLRDDKLIVAWSGSMITTLTLASAAMNNSQWLAAAERAAGLIWSQNIDTSAADLPLSRINLNGAVSIQGQLEDYANLAEALLVLFDVTANKSYLLKAARLLSATLDKFWDVTTDSFYLSQDSASGPALTRSRSAADGATLSPVATALRCLHMLLRRSALLEPDAPAFLPALGSRLNACTRALGARLNDNPMSHPSLLRIIAALERASIDHIQYAANGLARCEINITSRQAQQLRVTVNMSLQAHWHVTAPPTPNAGSDATTDSFVPLVVATGEDENLWQIDACEYPPANAAIQSHSGASVPVYAGELEFVVCLSRTAGTADALVQSVGLTLTVQLCSDQHCLLPESLIFRV